MSDQANLPKKARILVDAWVAAKKKGDRTLVLQTESAAREYARNQKDMKVRDAVLHAIQAEHEAPPRASRGSGGPGFPQSRGGGGGGARAPRPPEPTIAPSVFARPFHNPYTFLPFEDTAPRREKPSLLTADELDPTRRTGVLELELETRSPLLSADPVATNAPPQEGSSEPDHKTYRALTVGPDVIVPATGVRGSLRNLMTILVGGTLTNLDDQMYACQGRDARLGPANPKAPDQAPPEAFLGMVERPGTSHAPGTIRLGETRLLPLAQVAQMVHRWRCERQKPGDAGLIAACSRTPLEAPAASRDLEWWLKDWDKTLQPLRPTNRRKDTLFVEEIEGGYRVTGDAAASPRAWRLRLSGDPINYKGKREALFRPSDDVIKLPSELWRVYRARHQHAAIPELRRGDLVWLEPVSFSLQAIRRPEDVKSLQWARWGRTGAHVASQIPPHLQADALRRDGKVDVVTDLFGQVNLSENAPTFAGRIRPENLVFEDAVQALEKDVALSPLQPPHPGCAAFYRWQGGKGRVDPNTVSSRDDFRGYKVYRTAKDGDEPWRWEAQGVWDEAHPDRLKEPHQRVNKTVELLPAGRKGRLRIAFRALSEIEWALLLFICRQPWRLGGGKPFGLGRCEVKVLGAVDELGEAVSTEVDIDRILGDPAGAFHHVLRRAEWWQRSQEPVAFLRYPRAVDENKNKFSRGGHAWFARHANPKKAGRDDEPRGLEVFRTRDDLEQRFEGNAVAGQVLPPFDPQHPEADVLYGYDGIARLPRQEKNRTTYYGAYEDYDPTKHRPPAASGPRGSQAIRREDRRDQRRGGRGGPPRSGDRR